MSALSVSSQLHSPLALDQITALLKILQYLCLLFRIKAEALPWPAGFYVIYSWSVFLTSSLALSLTTFQLF